MTLTEKMIARARTFEKGQLLDQQLICMILDGLVEVGTRAENGGQSVLKAKLTSRGEEELAATLPRS